MKRVEDEIMVRVQEEAASKRRLLELGKLPVDSPTKMTPEQQARLAAIVSGAKTDT